MLIERQNKIINDLPNNSILYLFAGEEIMKSADQEYTFEVNKNFYYLTNIDQSNMILQISKIDNNISKVIYTKENDPIMAKWVGNRLDNNTILKMSCVDRVENINKFYDILQNSLNFHRAKQLKIYLDLYQFKPIPNSNSALRFATYLKDTYHINVYDCYNILCKSRLIKDQNEIDNIKKAINITRTGIEYLTSRISQCKEQYLQASFNFGLMISGCKKTAFDTIIASGVNATILHYIDNDKEFSKNDLILCDLGATYKHYCADITRTFPANLKFNIRQKDLYNLVLKGQLKVIENAKVGTTLGKLNQILIDYYKEELPKYNLHKDVSEYYFHSVAHMLGLDTHDINLYGKDTILENNMIITVEPGLYIEDEKIGIRIEDDILINNDQPIVLSKDIPKSVEEIELFLITNQSI